MKATYIVTPCCLTCVKQSKVLFMLYLYSSSEQKGFGKTRVKKECQTVHDYGNIVVCVGSCVQC